MSVTADAAVPVDQAGAVREIVQKSERKHFQRAISCVPQVCESLVSCFRRGETSAKAGLRDSVMELTRWN